MNESKKEKKTVKSGAAQTDSTNRPLNRWETWCEDSNRKNERSAVNPIAFLLNSVAWILYIGGFFVGIVLGLIQIDTGSYTARTDFSFSFPAALSCWSVALITGTLFMGLSEVIKLLEEIKNK